MGGPIEPTDVRMRGFRTRTPVSAAWALLQTRIHRLPSEVVPLGELAGRVLAEGVVAGYDVPAFPRSAMDGYAVRSTDTRTAGEGTPVRLEVVGEALPGRPFTGALGAGQAVRVMTGAPVPSGADAVVMVEHVETSGGTVAVRVPVDSGRNVSRVGEDVAKGTVVLRPGRRLRPQDVGLLAALGVASAQVVCRPRVAVVITGEELLPPGSAPSGYRIVDSNSPMLAALVSRDGGLNLPVRRLSDDPNRLHLALREAATASDVILVSGGSSVGVEDHAPRLVAELGELAVHGLAVKPAAPTGIGFLPGPAGSTVPVILLPGNPVSCLCAYDLFAGPVVRLLGGLPWEWPYRKRTGWLTEPVISVAGRVDYLRVRVEDGRVTPVAVGGASNLSSTVFADGFVLVEAERERIAAGEAVEVWLYDT